MSSPVSIVVGASSGIGECIGRRLAAAGHKVGLFARREGELQRIVAAINADAGSVVAAGFAHDVTELQTVEPAWERVESEFGQVGSLYYAAAILEDVELDEFDTARDKRHFDINTMGSVAWVNAAARRFGPRGSGTIVGISSVAQDRGRISRPAYNASKAAMDCHLEAIRNRLWRQGVTVTTIRPGFVESPMTAGAEGLFWLISADRAAELTIRCAHKRKAVAYIPARWRLMMTVVRLIPSFVFRKLNF